VSGADPPERGELSRRVHRASLVRCEPGPVYQLVGRALCDPKHVVQAGRLEPGDCATADAR